VPRFASLAGISLILTIIMACARYPVREGDAAVDRRVLTHDQVADTNAKNAYDAVSALRSIWLSPRGVDSFRTPGEVLVYFNDIRFGGVESLKEISTSDVGFIRYFSGSEAAARWGLDHGHGVIYVSVLPGY